MNYRSQRSWAKVMFLQASVILYTVGGGCLPQCMLGCHPPGADTLPRADTPPGADTPQSRHPRSRHPPGADTPRADTPLGADNPPWSRQPPLEQTPLRTKYIPQD